MTHPIQDEVPQAAADAIKAGKPDYCGLPDQHLTQAAGVP